MNKSTLVKWASSAIFLMLFFIEGFSCSTYKVTAGGKTMYGMNYDTWFTQPRIWFETNGYGAMFTGANNLNKDGYAPQAGMNVHGLSFGTLATETPENWKSIPGKKPIPGRTNYLKDILHSCKTVEEVQAYIEQYDHSALYNDVFIYTDKSGKYLVVEPCTMSLGTDSNYVLANFCPSTITDFSSIKQKRYQQGVAFLKNKSEASLEFCTALSDTMHVCRERIGDGTLLTSIWDLDSGIVNLYFYHDYNHLVQFHLEEELAKGDHYMEIASLFPFNPEFIDLQEYKTPMNSKTVDWFLRFCVVLFFFSAVYFFVSYLRKRREPFALYKLMLSLLGFVVCFYMFVLASYTGIFYFPAPYTGYAFPIFNIASYVPFMVLLLLVPFIRTNRKLFREQTWHGVTRWLFAFNNAAYLVLVAFFFYWGLYDVIH